MSSHPLHMNLARVGDTNLLKEGALDFKLNIYHITFIIKAY